MAGSLQYLDSEEEWEGAACEVQWDENQESVVSWELKGSVSYRRDNTLY